MRGGLWGDDPAGRRRLIRTGVIKRRPTVVDMMVFAACRYLQMARSHRSSMMGRAQMIIADVLDQGRGNFESWHQAVNA